MISHGIKGENMSELFLFPYGSVKAGSKVVLYGAGMIADDYMLQITENNYCEIMYIAASDYKENPKKQKKYWNIVNPESLKNYEDYDYVVLATIMPKFRDEMKYNLRNWGVPNEKIVSDIHKVFHESNSYSQHGEDMIIYTAFTHMGYFRDGKLPTYIDIGAHHPYNISNTALFHKKGCHGINIEANPELIKAFDEERPEDINLCVGIGAKEGEFPFYMTDVPGLNSFKRDNITYNEQLVERDTGKQEKYEIRKVQNIRIRKLPDIIDEYCNGEWPDFLSIDIEGMEYESLEICDLTNGPKLMAVEVNFNGDLFVELLDKKGYFPYLWYRENILFVRKDMINLVHAHDERG